MSETTKVIRGVVYEFTNDVSIDVQLTEIAEAIEEMTGETFEQRIEDGFAMLMMCEN